MNFEEVNLKNLSLSFYGLHVRITIKPGSDSFKNVGEVVEGRLVERKWGNKVRSDSKLTGETQEETIISLTISDGDKKINVPCEDIKSLKNLMLCNLKSKV